MGGIRVRPKLACGWSPRQRTQVDGFEKPRNVSRGGVLLLAPLNLVGAELLLERGDRTRGGAAIGVRRGALLGLRLV